MDVTSSGLPAAPEQAISVNGAALSGLLEVQEEGQATLLLPVVWGRNPTPQRRSRNHRVAVKPIIGVAVRCKPQPKAETGLPAALNCLVVVTCFSPAVASLRYGAV